MEYDAIDVCNALGDGPMYYEFMHLVELNAIKNKIEYNLDDCNSYEEAMEQIDNILYELDKQDIDFDLSCADFLRLSKNNERINRMPCNTFLTSIISNLSANYIDSLEENCCERIYEEIVVLWPFVGDDVISKLYNDAKKMFYEACCVPNTIIKKHMLYNILLDNPYILNHNLEFDEIEEKEHYEKFKELYSDYHKDILEISDKILNSIKGKIYIEIRD